MRLRHVLAAFAIIVLPVAGASVSQAQHMRHGEHGDWELLGKRSVGFLADHDTIKVGRSEGRFKRIKLKVSGNEIEMRDLKVVYGSGKVDDLPVREKIRAGGETRAIDLQGHKTTIREIQLSYASKPSFKGMATVEVWGLQ
jgi:hypothetical protein